MSTVSLPATGAVVKSPPVRRNSSEFPQRLSATQYCKMCRTESHDPFINHGGEMTKTIPAWVLTGGVQAVLYNATNRLYIYSHPLLS